MIELQRALQGSLLGLAVGDALGLAGEGLSRQRLARMYPDLSRYHFLFGRGMCSDDTEHACMCLQAWIAAQRPGQAEPHLAFARNLGWRLRGWLIALPAGVGLATGRAIIKLWLGWPTHRSGIFSAGNGAAMRAPVLGVLLGHDAAQLRTWVRSSSLLTHRDPLAIDGALVAAQAAHLSASGKPLPIGPTINALIALLPDAQSAMAQALRDVGRSVLQGESTAAFAAVIGCADGVSGYVMHTIPVVVHAWLSHPEDFAAALQTAIACGGDTDTVAAILGGIVGARVGVQGIPTAWLERLVEWPRSPHWMTRLASHAGAVALGAERPAPLALNVPALVLRNLVFLVVVLCHGFRRLLPPY
jgi:ADP-ribosylglycohydrolase